MIVKKYKAQVSEVNTPAENIFNVDFRSHNGAFKFLPGQFLHLALDDYDPSKGWPESRCFSMQSAPGNDILRITFSVKGAFTRRMAEELLPGMELYLKLPFGELFQQDHTKENCVFIAGGTGITPFLSLFSDHSFSLYSGPVLYAGFKSKAFNVYRQELKRASEINPAFSVTYCYEDVEGMINLDEIYSRHGHQAVYFISGPPLMIRSFKNSLIKKGVLQDNIKTDEWE